MYNYQIGERFIIHSYKHDGSIHRSWDEAILLENNSDYLVFGNDKTRVVESDGRTWRTKEPAIMFFYKHSWYNVIGQLKYDGIYYYCNLASPFVIEDKTIKYIDYDLDLRIFPKGDYKILDKLEYEYHKTKMGYSDDLDFVINTALEDLINDYENHLYMFDSEKNIEYTNLYFQLKKSFENSNFS